MPHKHNDARRHHIGKMEFKVTNWAEYEAGLRRRGSLTLWVTPEALSRWVAPRRKTRGGQPRYSDLAIETTLMLPGSGPENEVKGQELVPLALALAAAVRLIATQ